MDSLTRRGKIIRENAFGQKKKKPELKFNPGLALMGLRKTGPWSIPLVTKGLEGGKRPQREATRKMFCLI